MSLMFLLTETGTQTEGWLVLSDSAWKMICETCAMFFSLIGGIRFSRQNLLSFEAAHMIGNEEIWAILELTYYTHLLTSAQSSASSSKQKEWNCHQTNACWACLSQEVHFYCLLRLTLLVRVSHTPMTHTSKNKSDAPILKFCLITINDRFYARILIKFL